MIQYEYCSYINIVQYKYYILQFRYHKYIVFICKQMNPYYLIFKLYKFAIKQIQ